MGCFMHSVNSLKDLPETPNLLKAYKELSKSNVGSLALGKKWRINHLTFKVTRSKNTWVDFVALLGSGLFLAALQC